MGKYGDYRCILDPHSLYVRVKVRARATGTTRPGAVPVNYWWAEKKWWQSNEIINVAELMMNENKKSRGSLEPTSSLAMQSYHILFWSRHALGLFPSLPQDLALDSSQTFTQNFPLPSPKTPHRCYEKSRGVAHFPTTPLLIYWRWRRLTWQLEWGLQLFLLVGGLHGKRCRLRACKWSGLLCSNSNGAAPGDGIMQTSWGLIS